MGCFQGGFFFFFFFFKKDTIIPIQTIPYMLTTRPDPLLYDRCIRRFLTPAEREADGRKKGYSGVLEADLYRSEAKLQALNPDLSLSSPPSSSKHDPLPYVALSYSRGPDGEVIPEEPDEVPQSREEGEERWKFQMTLRFLRGEDEEFDYERVDENEEFDAVERREREERWFDEEEPSSGGNPECETGIQDF